MPKCLRLSVLLLCTASAPSAQAPEAAEIVLPPKIVAGQSATLAVLDHEGQLASGVEIEFSGGNRVMTDATGRAFFRAPTEPGVLLVRIAGSRVSGSATVVAPPTELPDGVQVASVPPRILAHDRFTVIGSGFRGAAEENRATVGDRPALVLAASPLALVVMPGPDAPVGPAQLVVEVGGRSPGPVPLRILALEIETEKSALAPREKSKLKIHVRGSDQQLQVEVRNLTPATVKMKSDPWGGGWRGESEVRRMTTSGGADNFASVEIESLRAGEFSFSARLVPEPAGAAEVEAARERLLAARGLAPAGWERRVERLIQQLATGPQNARRVQVELKKMLSQNPPEDFGRLLEAAWRALLGR